MSLLPTLNKITTLTKSYQQKERKELERTITISVLQKRRNELLLSGTDKEELKIIENKLNYLNYGIE